MKWLSLHVGGQKWSVFVVSPRSKYLANDDGGFDVGKCHYNLCRITLSKDLDQGAREDTLLHELLHALLFVTGAERAYGGDPKKDEMLVSALTPTLHRLLKDLGFRFPNAVSY